MKSLSFLVAFTVAWVAVAPSAFAVTVRNNGPEPQIVQVTENGERKEIPIPATSDVEVCPKGCFLTFPVGPTGDLLTVKGSETVLIEGGKARIIAP